MRGQCFDYGHAEVFLMRWQNERFGVSQSALFQVWAEHSREDNAASNSEPLHTNFQFLLPSDLTGPAEDDRNLAVVVGDFRESFNRQIAAFFWMKPAQKQ